MAATCSFSKEFVKSRTVPTNRKKGIEIKTEIVYAIPLFKKRLTNLKKLINSL
jgi:hypothetical protein